MRLSRLATPTLVLTLAAMPLPVYAQDAPAEEDVAEVTDALSDPGNQLRAQLMARAMAAMLLELPVGPLARAAAEMGGEDPEAIDPDLTVREFAGPRAEDLPQEIGDRVPEMMDRLAGMSGAIEDMLPALRQWGETMRAIGTAPVD